MLPWTDPWWVGTRASAALDFCALDALAAQVLSVRYSMLTGVLLNELQKAGAVRKNANGTVVRSDSLLVLAGACKPFSLEGKYPYPM